MFNFLLRPYVPGVRIRLQDDVPGFAIDENGLPRRETTWSDVMGLTPATPHLPDTVRPLTTHIIGFPTPGPEVAVQPTPPIGFPAFRVKPTDDVPGFNVRPQEGLPGFNLSETGAPRQEVAWPEGVHPESVTPQYPEPAHSLPPPPGVENPVQPAPPQLPEWLHNLLTMPLPQVPTAVDARTGQRVVPYAPLVNTAGPYWPTDQSRRDLGRPRAYVPATGSPRGLGSVKPSAAEQRPSIDTKMASLSTDAPPTPSVRPVGVPNFILANAGDGGEQQAQQPRPVRQVQLTQQTMRKMPPATGRAARPAAPRFPEAPGVEMTEEEFSQLIEAYRRLKEAEGRQPIRDRSSPQLPQNENAVVHSSASDRDGPSFLQELAQAALETTVPGAHYHRLARQQLEARNYVGAAVYQTAALVDAALGAATLGVGARLGAAGRTAAAEGAALFRRGFDSLSQLQRYLGRAPEGMQWHHIVEQSQASQFGQRAIQSVENVVAIPIETHQRLNAFYSSKRDFSRPTQYAYGYKGNPLKRSTSLEWNASRTCSGTS